MAKLEKILESMDSFKINSEVALLENTDLTDLTRAQTRKEIHESFNFIKEELTKGGLLEETQQLLAETWTQAIMEDMEMPSNTPLVSEENEFGAGDAAAIAAGTGAIGAGIRYGTPAAQAAYKANVNSDANLTGTTMAGKQAATGQFNSDLAAVKGALNAGINKVRRVITK